MKIRTWKTQVDGKEKDESILDMITAIVNMIPPNELPRSFTKFQIFGRLNKAFDKALKTNELILEEEDYKFVEGLIDKYIPSVWALNKNYNQAIETFMNLEEE